MINHKQLKEICRKPLCDFSEYGDKYITPDGILYYKDNGSKILAVAHLDTVQNSNHYRVVDARGSRIIFTPQLDDRLGAYVILHLLPSLGIKTDILLTEGEETGKSTAKHFKVDKEYNWMFSFDRAGTDTVLYQYHDKAMEKLLTEHGFNVQTGAFSDIGYLEHLGIKGFNFGVGYYNNHALQAYAVEHHILYNVLLFQKFYSEFEDVILLHFSKKAKTEEKKTGDQEKAPSTKSGKTTAVVSSANKPNCLNVCIICRSNWLTERQIKATRICANCSHINAQGELWNWRQCLSCHQDFLPNLKRRTSTSLSAKYCLDCRICFDCKNLLLSQAEVDMGCCFTCHGNFNKAGLL